jgi:hypothetical protein
MFTIMLSTVIEEVRLGEEFPCRSPNIEEVRLDEEHLGAGVLQ